jgi:Mrp family chromosome partitioning ATPase
LNERQKVIDERMSKIKHKIVVMSGKGGVGKTTVAVNLAIKLASLGFAVGIMDVDITGPNVPHMLKMEGQRPYVNPTTKTFSPINGPLNLKVMSMAFLLETDQTPVIWRGPMKMSAIRQFISDAEWGYLDVMVFDLPPGTSDETLDILQIAEGCGVIVVTTPQDVALLDARKTVNMSKVLERKMLGIIENMSGFICPKCGEKVDLFGMGGGEKAAKTLEVPFLGSIPFEIGVREQGDDGIPFIIKYPESMSANAFDEIVKKIINEIK